LKTILLMRHARAGDTRAGEHDYDRSLTADGNDMAFQTGRILASLNLSVDRIIASAAARTQQTAELVSEEINATRTRTAAPPVAIICRPELYHASAHGFAKAAGQHAFDDESTVLIVGHNPGIGTLMCYWAQKGLDVSPATLVAFRFDLKSWTDVKASHNEGVRIIAIIQDGKLQQVDPSLQPEPKG
jgi:phosphohistidine phosphatase